MRKKTEATTGRSTRSQGDGCRNARPTTEKLQKPDTLGKKIGELKSLVQGVLDQLDDYGISLVTRRSRVRVEHPLRLALDSLATADPDTFAIGTEGRFLVGRILIGSLCETRSTDRIALFKHANELAAWLRQRYLIPTDVGQPAPLITNPNPDRQGGSSARVTDVHPPFPELGTTRFEILEATDHEPRRGSEIAELSGYTHDTVRRHLPRLVELGLIKKTERGYYRTCSLCEHTPDTRAAQTPP